MGEDATMSEAKSMASGVSLDVVKVSLDRSSAAPFLFLFSPHSRSVFSPSFPHSTARAEINSTDTETFFSFNHHYSRDP
jgi:hypothetical protein